MYLTASNLAYYLISRGIVTGDSVVSGDFRVLEAGRRNRNFKILRQKSPGLFIKQIKDASPEAAATLYREAAFYKLVSAKPEFSLFARFLPQIRDYNPSSHSLIVDLLPEAENLTEYYARLQSFPVAVAEMLGHILAVTHSQLSALWTDASLLSIFPKLVPWVLPLDPGHGPDTSTLGAPGKLFADLLAQFSDLLPHLFSLRGEWRIDALLHGDMKWDNCLLHQESKEEIDLRLIDWELVDVGDACWDLGSIIASYLLSWLSILPATEHTEENLRPVRDVHLQMRPSLQALWKSYSSTRGLTPAISREYLKRCLRFTAARLVLAAFEFLYVYPVVTPSVLYMLQMSRNIFLSPERAAQEWFEGGEAHS